LGRGGTERFTISDPSRDMLDFLFILFDFDDTSRSNGSSPFTRLTNCIAALRDGSCLSRGSSGCFKRIDRDRGFGSEL